MSIREAQSNSTYKKIFSKKTLPSTTAYTWTRNPSWLALPSMTSSDSKFIGLYTIYQDVLGGENSNFIAFNCAADYTVDWGDGSVTENFSSGVNAYHTYDYNNANLNNTNAPVTLVDSGDLVQRTSHGYTNGMIVKFYNITSTTGITEGQNYYVINANSDDFQISTTSNGSPVTLTTNGTATLLDYKQAIVTITPQVGQNLTSINLDIKHNASATMSQYCSGWRDIKLGSPNLTSLIFINPVASNILHYLIEKIEIVNIGLITNTSNLFQNLNGLKSVPLFDTTNVTNMSYMFDFCKSLTSVPLFNTANVTNMQSMFSNCKNLTSVPLFDTTNVTNMQSMFSLCLNLTSVPLFNTTNVTNMQSMFDSCNSLTSVPLFNTTNVTNMSYMFILCSNLTSVPLFNTANVTNMQSMFDSCSNLTSVPLFNTANVTNKIGRAHV